MTEASYQLRIRQAYSLDLKIQVALRRIKEWLSYWNGQCYVAYSGGKDSQVLLHLVRQIDSSIPAVFTDTGLEFPEVKSHVKQTDNVVYLNPTRSYAEVIAKYGYPVVSKDVANKLYKYKKTKRPEYREKLLQGKYKIPYCWRHLLDSPYLYGDKCCDMMKIRPIQRYEKQSGRTAFVGLLASESRFRTMHYYQHGCQIYHATRPVSRPLAIWTDADIWAYIHQHQLPYAPVYDMGYARTSCIFCMFGVHKEQEPNRFQRLKQTHPKLWRYCMDTLGLRDVCLHYLHVPIE